MFECLGGQCAWCRVSKGRVEEDEVKEAAGARS